MIVTFGKYKGKEISELPLDYLAWGAMNLNNKWKSLFLEAYTTKLQESDLNTECLGITCRFSMLLA